jgi:DNA-repair protein XRCC2
MRSTQILLTRYNPISYPYSIINVYTSQLLTDITDRHLGPSPLSLTRGDVVQVQGPPSSGKTHLVYLFLIICITPREHQSVAVGGWDKAAIVFDMDGSFNIIRFNRLLLGRLKRLFSFDMHVTQTVAQSSLEKLHIFRPMSSTQLAMTLTQLGRYHTAHLPGSEIGLVAVDSINAYHWPDRLVAEHIQTSSEHRKASSLTLPQLRISTALSSLRATLAPVIIQTIRGVQYGAPASVDPLISTHHITLSTVHVQHGMLVATPNNHRQEEVVDNVEIIASMQRCSTVDSHSFTLRIAEEEVVAS